MVFVACMLAIFIAAIEATIVATAMPTIVADLGGFDAFSWVFAAYLLTQAVTIPIYGRCADLYGRKRVFYDGAAHFLASSTLCGLAWNMSALVLFRVLQGLGAGAIQPIAMTIVGDIYTPVERARVQGYISSVWGVASITGPLLGGFLVQYVGWSLVFWVNLPIGAISILLLMIYLKEPLRPRQHQIDYLGSALLVLGVGALMLALLQAASLPGWMIAGLLVVATSAFFALVLQERRAAEPVIPMDLWRNPLIAVSNLGCFAIGALLMGVTAFLPTYVQGVLGRTPGSSGLVLAATSLSWSIASTIAGRLMVQTSYRFTATVGGFALVAGSAVMIAMAPSDGVFYPAAAAALIGIGMGFCNTAFLVAVQASVGFEFRGTATSSNMFMRNIGQALGIALFGAVLNWSLFLKLPTSGEAINNLMDPAKRESLASGEIIRLTTAIAVSLHAVYLLAGLFAVLTVLLAIRLPKGLSPTAR